MPTGSTVDSIDAKILKTQTEDSRATVIALADMTSLSQNTVQARLSKLENQGVLHPFERRIDPVALGYPLTAFILTGVTQWKLTPIAESMDRIPKAIEVHGRSGVTDVLIHVVARDADDFYRIAGRILDIDGVEQTTTALVRPQLAYRLNSPLAQLVDGRDRGGVIKVLTDGRGKVSVASSLLKQSRIDCDPPWLMLNARFAFPDMSRHHPQISRMRDRQRRHTPDYRLAESFPALSIATEGSRERPGPSASPT